MAYNSPVENAVTRRFRLGSGGGRRNRTDDTLLAKQVLYQLSYAPSNQIEGGGTLRTSGGSGWIRTNDPRLIKTVL